MSRRPLTPEDLYLFRWVDHVRLSPTGEWVAYQVTWADADARRNHGRVVVAGTEPRSPAIELRSDVQRDHSPEWSPDGSHIAVLSRLGARDQLFAVGADGRDATRLTDIPDGVLAAHWSPDGRGLAFTAWVVGDPDAVVDDPRPPDGEELSRRPPIARVVRTLSYKRDGVGYLDGRHVHLFIVDADGGEPCQLTDGAWSIGASAGRRTGAR